MLIQYLNLNTLPTLNLLLGSSSQRGLNYVSKKTKKIINCTIYEPQKIYIGGLNLIK